VGYFIGLMSGTSMDAVDTALVEFSDSGLSLIATHTHTLPVETRQQLELFVTRTVHDIHQLGELDVAIGELFAEATLQLLADKYSPSQIRAIGSHGQTVFHAPRHSTPFTLQIGDPNIIAERTGITTVADFRRRDMAAGGQGAPLVPAFHNALFRSPDHNRVVLNIGGIANITILPADPQQPVRGFDTGPGNTLLDAWARRHLNQPMDRDGQWAASGHVNQRLLDHWLKEPFFAAPPPKSSGRELFNLHWLEQAGVDDRPENIQATLVQLTIESIARAIETHADATEELFVCGGGAYNPALMQGLGKRLNNIQVRSTEQLGLKPTWVEAVAFAWLAKQTIEGKPGNLPEATGARHPVILGAIYPA
jgi:anhydro-N-acetylmuramic acid kinase